MIGDKLKKIIPPPVYLKMSAIGLDISDRSIKYAELAKKGDFFELARFGRTVLPEGLLQSGEIKNAPELKKFLKSVFKDLSGSSIIISLPEERAFVELVSLPKISEEDIRGALELQIDEHIPLPAEEAIFDYEIVHGSGGDHVDVEVVAFPKKLVESYVEIVRDIGLMPIAAEMEAEALSRSVIPLDFTDTAMIVDFGRTRSSFIIVSSGVVRFTSTVKVAGEALDEALAKSFSVGLFEAERIKKEKGFVRTKENQEVFNTLLPVVSAICDEISRYLGYWKNHAEHVHNSSGKSEVGQIFLSGGDVNLIGLSEYLTYKLKLPVKLANPWANISYSKNYVPEISYKESLSYATALGLAIRVIQHD